MSSSAPPAQEIKKLDEAVVNKIAAGEVIQRPASALKELLENSVDAGATQIVVTVKEGGNKLLQITDNGTGIRDSEMQPPGPKPVASVRGTTITVEDMFYYNVARTRNRALKSSAEEYAIFKTGVAFSCKRQGESRTDLTTLASAARLDNIRTVYGPAVSKELMPIQVKGGEEVSAKLGAEDGNGSLHHTKCAQLCVGPAKKEVHGLVLVSSTERAVRIVAPLKRAIEATYASILPKASHPWMFLDLRLPPRQKFVRTDHRAQTLDAFMQNPYQAAAMADRPDPLDLSGNDIDLLSNEEPQAGPATQMERSVRTRRQGPLNASKSELTSVVELLRAVDDKQA
eukprot:gene32311-16880_t